MVTYVGTVIAFLVALFALVYVITNVFKIVPVQFTQIVNALIEGRPDTLQDRCVVAFSYCVHIPITFQREL